MATRIIDDDVIDIPLFRSVLCQNDYLSSICIFLTMKEVIESIPLISTFHHKFMNNISQKRLIHALMSRDFNNNKDLNNQEIIINYHVHSHSLYL